MISSFVRGRISQVAAINAIISFIAFGQEARDLVKGNLIQFNDNGAWSWYQDERAVIDGAGGKLIVGSDASNNGVGGSPREGDVEAVIFHLQTGLSERFTLKEGNPIFYADDHNAPAFLVRPDGKYLAMYAAHFGDSTSHYRIYSDGAWREEEIFNWRAERPGGVNFQTTYSNLFQNGQSFKSDGTLMDVDIFDSDAPLPATFTRVFAAGTGAADGRWHERTGFGNGNSVLTSAELGGENAPALQTRVTVPGAGTYDIWVNFWANPAADWRIRAGLSEGGMQIFRQVACKQVEPGDHDAALVLSGSGNTFLYQANVGRLQVSADNTFEVFVDDSAIRVGTQNTLVGDIARTWYDGVSYARVDNMVSVAENENYPLAFRLSQNYPNPFNPATTIAYSVPRAGPVKLSIYDLLGREVVTLVHAPMPAGTHRVSWNAQDVPSGVYFYRLTVGDISQTNKMVLMR